MGLINNAQRYGFTLLVIGLLMLTGSRQSIAFADDAATTTTAPATTSTAPAEARAPSKGKAISVSNIAPQASATYTSLQSIQEDLSDKQGLAEIQEGLATLERDSQARQEEGTRMLAASPSPETLRRLNNEWQSVHDEVDRWQKTMRRLITQSDDDRAKLAQFDDDWTATQAAVHGLKKVPPAVVTQMEHVLTRVRDTEKAADAQQMTLLDVQTRLAQQGGRARRMLINIEAAREEFIRRLFARDGAPIWSRQMWSQSAQDVASQSRTSFSRQLQALSAYVPSKGGSFVLQLALFLVILAILVGVRRVTRELGGEDAIHAAKVFDSPALTALVLALLAGMWIYQDAPRLFQAILGAALIIPTALVVRRLIDRRLFAVLNALVVFYFVDQLRLIVASQLVIARLLLMAEMLAGALFTLWLITGSRLGNESSTSRSWKLILQALWVALAWFALAFISDALGYVTLAKLLGHGLLQSAYMALILYAVVRIVDGLVFTVLSIPPLHRLSSVKRHLAMLRNRTRIFLQFAAVVLWVIYVLEALSLRALVFHGIYVGLNSAWTVGSFSVSLGDVLTLALVIWASFLISRLVRFFLEEEIYSRVHLAPGLHYSISKMVNYAILVIGFFIAIAMIGFDLTKLTILIGAFGVGLGFGLQNIINNFVSGLILLFERPIKVGDIIQVAGSQGVVKHIGIRASIVQSSNGSEFIVPNGALISETVTNWTFTDRLRRIDLPVAIVGPADPNQVIQWLKDAALSLPQVLKDPPPEALLTNFSAGGLNFELRVWIAQTEDSDPVRSDLALAVRAKLAEHNIALK